MKPPPGLTAEAWAKAQEIFARLAKERLRNATPEEIEHGHVAFVAFAVDQLCALPSNLSDAELAARVSAMMTDSLVTMLDGEHGKSIRLYLEALEHGYRSQEELDAELDAAVVARGRPDIVRAVSAAPIGEN